jgi:hypothetical protein
LGCRFHLRTIKPVTPKKGLQFAALFYAIFILGLFN